MDHELISYIIFFVVIVAAMAFDLGLHKKHEMPFREAIHRSIAFIALALCFNAYIWLDQGSQSGMEFFAGYMIELSLSVDNLFIFILIFSTLKISKEAQQRVLFWGILGALILRGLFVTLGGALVHQFSWVLYIFGAFLIYSGAKIFFHKEQDSPPQIENNILVRFFRKFIPITSRQEGTKFFIQRNGKLWATPLFLVLILVESTDILFALDSIPAIFAVTQKTFIVFTSNIFAILGLRSLFFCVSGLMAKLIYLKQALAIILLFIGVKMLASHFIEIPIWLSLVIIVFTLLVATIASIVRTKKQN